MIGRFSVLEINLWVDHWFVYSSFRSGKTKYVFSVFVKKWDCFWICFNRDCLKNEKVKSTYLTSFNQYGTCSTLYFIKANQTAFSCTIYIPKIKIQSLVFLALPLLYKNEKINMFPFFQFVFSDLTLFMMEETLDVAPSIVLNWWHQHHCSNNDFIPFI